MNYILNNGMDAIKNNIAFFIASHILFWLVLTLVIKIIKRFFSFFFGGVKKGAKVVVKPFKSIRVLFIMMVTIIIVFGSAIIYLLLQ